MPCSDLCLHPGLAWILSIRSDLDQHAASEKNPKTSGMWCGNDIGGLLQLCWCLSTFLVVEGPSWRSYLGDLCGLQILLGPGKMQSEQGISRMDERKQDF